MNQTDKKIHRHGQQLNGYQKEGVGADKDKGGQIYGEGKRFDFGS